LEVNSAAVEYIEVTRGDIALANRLAHAVLGRSLDELPPQTRRVLAALDGWVAGQSSVQGIDRGGVRFTRRTVRAHLGLSDTQLRVHLDRLVQLDYIAVHGGKVGQRFAYSLLFDGDAERDGPQAMGITDAAIPEMVPTSRGETATSRGSDPNLAGGLRGDRGGVAAPSRGVESAKNTEKIALDRANAPVVAQKARSRKVNGHAAAEH